MFFKKGKKEKMKKQEFIEESTENKNFSNDEIEIFENTGGDLELNNDGVKSTLSYREEYTIILRIFLNEFETLTFERDRLVAMLEVGTLDEESIVIIDDVKYVVDSTLETYNMLFESNIGEVYFLDSQCKNIDYRIRHGLKIESESLEKMNESILGNNAEEFQNAIYSNAKGMELVNESFSDINELVIENYF
ncbi:hypothetical protein ACWEVF_05640 [Staphylococcus xylosus]